MQTAGFQLNISSPSLAGIEKSVFHVQIFEVVKSAFWQGHFFHGTSLLRTSAGTGAPDATSRKDFFRRYCNEPIRKVVPNHFDYIFQFSTQMAGLRWAASRARLCPVSVLLYKPTLYEIFWGHYSDLSS